MARNHSRSLRRSATDEHRSTRPLAQRAYAPEEQGEKKSVWVCVGLWLIAAGTLVLLFPDAGPAEAPMNITRIELFFDNHRAETTVERNTPGLKAYALIRFSGSGLLQGNWWVDGRIIGTVSRHVSGGQTITLETPDNPSLPTFDPGTHRVRFVPLPIPGIPVPTALYFVSAGEIEFRSEKLALSWPVNQAVLEYCPLMFKWTPLHKTAVYLIEFYDTDKGGNPVFSAFTREPVFMMNDFLLSRICTSDTPYYWKVKGYDQRNKVVGESDLWSFRVVRK